MVLQVGPAGTTEINVINDAKKSMSHCHETNFKLMSLSYIKPGQKRFSLTMKSIVSAPDDLHVCSRNQLLQLGQNQAFVLSLPSP